MTNIIHPFLFRQIKNLQILRKVIFFVARALDNIRSNLLRTFNFKLISNPEMTYLFTKHMLFYSKVTLNMVPNEALTYYILQWASFD